MAGLTVGFAFATTLSGILIDARGASAAYVVLTVCALLAAALTVAGTRSLGRALAAAESLEAADAPEAASGPGAPTT